MQEAQSARRVQLVFRAVVLPQATKFHVLQVAIVCLVKKIALYVPLDFLAQFNQCLLLHAT